MGRVALIFHAKDCCGCHACEVACKQEHGLSVGPRLVRIIEKGSHFKPIYCYHCSRPPCRDICPTDAIYQDKRGIVLINEEACIGCKACFDACPFGAIQFDDEKEVAIKCDLCQRRVKEGQKPICVEVCPTHCILLRDMASITSKIDSSR